VEDKGCGISKEDLKHMFEPFFKSKDNLRAQLQAGGNGLGLNICK
jgi:signal transduction histidine kinase